MMCENYFKVIQNFELANIKFLIFEKKFSHTDLGYHASTQWVGLNPTTGEWPGVTDMPLLLSSADIHLSSFSEGPGS
jgi:hypothetical protein